MEQIIINDLNIGVVQTITGIKLTNPHAVSRTSTGIVWGGRVQLMSGNNPISNNAITSVIRNNTEMSFAELNNTAQSEYSKDYLALSVAESQTVQGTVLATKMITAIITADVGISNADVTTLVTSIVSALA